MEPARGTCVTCRSERMVFDDEIVAVSLLTREEVRVLGSSLKQVYPVPRDGKFEDLLRALDRDAPRYGTSTQAPE